MTEAETLEIINHLLNQAGSQLGVKLDHPSALEPNEWSNWTWEIEQEENRPFIRIKHWKDQYDFDREDLLVRLPPILTELEQESFVNHALKKIDLLKSRSRSPLTESRGA